MSKITNLQKKAIDALNEIHKVYQGNGIVMQFMAGVVSQASILLQSSHGKGKSLLSESISKVLGATYQRVQGTPGLVESQFIGRYNIPSLMKDKEIVEWRNFLKAKIKFFDELNRVPPQTLASLHTVLAEKKAIYGNEEINLEPFVFIAAMNPADAGSFDTYAPLFDRFDLCLFMPTPKYEMKKHIYAGQGYQPKQILQGDEINQIWNEVKAMPIPDGIGGIKGLAFEMIRDLQLCKQGDKEYLLNFPSCCKNCTFEESICAKVDNKNTVSERAYISALRVVKGVAYLKGKEHPDKTDFEEILSATLSHRVSVLRTAYPNAHTKQATIDSLINDLKERHKERSKGAFKHIEGYIAATDAKDKLLHRKFISDFAKNDLLVNEMLKRIDEKEANPTGA